MINLIEINLLDTPSPALLMQIKIPKQHQQGYWLSNDSWKIILKVVASPQWCAINRAKVVQLLTFNPEKYNPCVSKGSQAEFESDSDESNGQYISDGAHNNLCFSGGREVKEVQTKDGLCGKSSSIKTFCLH